VVKAYPGGTKDIIDTVCTMQLENEGSLGAYGRLPVANLAIGSGFQTPGEIPTGN
jgi:hypothetical protein